MDKSGPDREPFPRPYEALPDFISRGRNLARTCRRPQEKTLNLATGRAPTVQPCGQDGGVVADEGVAWSKEAGKFGKEMMRNRMVGSIDYEQPGAITQRAGGLRDKMRWQRIVKKFGSEGSHSL